MNVCGIVSEYNPFHSGHLLHIEETKKIVGPDCSIVCVMSGNYVQRGDFAIMPKHARAKAAVLCGADLIIELPSPYAMSSAESFAKAAVYLLDATGVVTHLSFGSEAGDVEPLKTVATALLTDDFKETLKPELKKGVSFAAAREAAAKTLLGSELSTLLASPNNILGIEYLKSLITLNSPVSPVTIRRIGASHDEACANGRIASASAIRAMLLKESPAGIESYLPEKSFEVLKYEIKNGLAPVTIKNADRQIVSYLKRLPADYFLSLPDVSEGLEQRLFNAVSAGSSFEHILSLAKTKRYTLSRIRRVLLSAYLGATKDITLFPPPYLRVLAFSLKGRALLKTMKKRASLPVVIKPSSVKDLCGRAITLFELERLATDLYNLALPESTAASFEEYRKSPILVL